MKKLILLSVVFQGMAFAGYYVSSSEFYRQPYQPKYDEFNIQQKTDDRKEQWQTRPKGMTSGVTLPGQELQTPAGHDTVALKDSTDDHTRLSRTADEINARIRKSTYTMPE